MESRTPAHLDAANLLGMALLVTNGDINTIQMVSLLEDVGLLNEAAPQGLDGYRIIKSNEPPDIELPEGQVWVWLAGATPPHWAIKGTEVRL